MPTTRSRYSVSTEDHTKTEHDRTETTEIVNPSRVNPLLPTQTPRRNNIAYIIISICLYFQENYYASIVPSVIPRADRVGICLSFIFIPALCYKLFLINFFSRFSVRIRMAIVSFGFFFSGISYFILLNIKSIKESETLIIIIVILLNSISSFSMGMGEASALEDASYYQKTCAANYSTGHGLSGVISAGLALILSRFMKKTHMIGFAAIPGVILFLTEFFLLGTKKFPDKPNIIKKSKTKELNTSGSKTNRADIKPKQKYNTWQMFSLLFCGPFAYYSLTFFFDYLLYFLAYSGVIAVSKTMLQFQAATKLCLEENPGSDKCYDLSWLKEQNKYMDPTKDQMKSFFEFAFFILKLCTFLCKLLPYVISIYKVAIFPMIHIFTIIGLLLSTIFYPNIAIILTLAAFVGMSHGLTSSFVIIALRKKIEERWLKFGLKYITVASSLGGSMGCLLSLGVSNLVEIACGVNF